MSFDSPSDRRYRVIQWGVGNVGTLALRHFIDNPAFEVVGVLCNRQEKVGKDAGELVGTAPIGVLAPPTRRPEALDADPVFYAPLWSDPDLRLARIVSRIDAIDIYEVVNFGKDTFEVPGRGRNGERSRRVPIRA